MGWLDTIGSAVKGVGGWVGDNADWLGPAVQGGMSLWQESQKGDSRGDIVSALQAAEQQNWEQGKQYHDAYTAYLQQANQIRAANAARAAQAAAAAAQARRAQDEARMQALVRSGKRVRKGAKQARGRYKPWAEMGERLMPQAENTYSDALNGMGMLMAFLNSPEKQAKLQGQARPSYAIDLFGGKK